MMQLGKWEVVIAFVIGFLLVFAGIRIGGFAEIKTKSSVELVPGVVEIQQMLIDRGYLDVNDPNATDGRIGPVTQSAWDRCICDQYAAGVRGAVEPYTQVPQTIMEHDYLDKQQ